MWAQVQKLIQQTQEAQAASAKPGARLANLSVGSVIGFSQLCPLPQLAGRQASVVQVNTYRFGEDMTISYALRVGEKDGFSLTVAEDVEGFYLAISRELNALEQDQWFGRDALSFFTEESTAKTIRCKIDLAIEGDWAAPRYVKSVDWVPGAVMMGRAASGAVGGRQVRNFHYNLLTNETGERALEIEHDDQTDANRVLVTVYRPIEDIAQVNEPLAHVPPPETPVVLNIAKTPANDSAPPAPAAEPPLFTAETVKQPVRPDFRRLNVGAPAEPIHVAREEMKPQPAMDAIIEAGMPPLPSFLTKSENNYLSLDEVIPPETDRVRCDLRSAKAMIDMAIARGVRVRDIMREIVGLDSLLGDEVIFELPLSDNDYRELAMRYRVRPDARDDIRRRLQQELNERLIGVAKR